MKFDDINALEFPVNENIDKEESVVKSLTPNQIRGMQAIEIFNSLLKTGDLNRYNNEYPMVPFRLMPQSVSTIESSKVYSFINYLRDPKPGAAKKFQSIISNITGEVVEEGDYLASIESYLEYFDFDPDIAHLFAELLEYTINGGQYEMVTRVGKVMSLYREIYEKIGIPTLNKILKTDNTSVGNFYRRLAAAANYGVRVKCKIEYNHQSTCMYVNQTKKLIEACNELQTGLFDDEFSYLINNPDLALDKRVDIVNNITLELFRQFTKKTFKYREISDDEIDELFDKLVRNNYDKHSKLSAKLRKFYNEVLLHNTIRAIKARLYAKVMNS